MWYEFVICPLRALRGDGKMNKSDREQRLLREESWVRSAVPTSFQYASSPKLKACSNNVSMSCIMLAYPKSVDTITAKWHRYYWSSLDLAVPGLELQH